MIWSLVIGAVAGLLGTLVMCAFEIPMYRARGLSAVPPFEMNIVITRNLLRSEKIGGMPAHLGAHFADGAGFGVVFVLVWPSLAASGPLLAGVAFGIPLWLFSACMYRVLLGRWLWYSRQGRAALAFTFATHVLFSIVVAYVLSAALL